MNRLPAHFTPAASRTISSSSASTSAPLPNPIGPGTAPLCAPAAPPAVGRREVARLAKPPPGRLALVRELARALALELADARELGEVLLAVALAARLALGGGRRRRHDG